ncbi:MAG: PAS domain S-box protein [Chloroflexi bacterium]|nr:PAS domain S-box protein [Chloroflexota bacterium]
MDSLIRVLYVDDYPLDRELVRDALEQEYGGFVVTEAASRQEFEARLAAGAYDVVLSDFNILGFDGLAVLDAVRAVDPTVPVVIVTGTGSEEVAAEAIKRGAADYVLKSPRHIRRLPQTIHAALEKQRTQQEREQAEQRIAALLRFQNEMLDTAATWIDTLDAAGNIAFWNRAAERISGYTREEVMGHGRVWEWLYPDPEDRARIFARAMAIIQRGERVENLETIIRCKDGERRTISWHSNNLVDKTGQTVGSIALGADVTERKRMEEALAASEERYRLLFYRSPVGVLHYDPHLRITDCNARFVTVLQSSRERLIGLDMTTLTDQSVLPALRQALIGEDGFYEGLYRATTGTAEVWVSMRTAPLVDARGQITGGVGIVEDITERKRIEEAEHEQRALAEALRDTAAALASTLSFDEVLDRILIEVGRVVPHDAARIILVEDGVARAARSRGYAEQEPEAPSQLLHAPVDTVVNLRTMAETGRPLAIPDTRSYPGWLDWPQTRWVRSNASAPIKIKEWVIGFLGLDSAQPGFFTQVHAERLQAFADEAAVAIENARLYDEVRRHAAELEQKVAERTAELTQREAALRAANEQLQQLSRLKSEFVSNVSHELRTPLANIKTYLWLLERGKPEKHAKYMETLHRESELLQSLIEDLLHLSRLDLGKVQPVLAPVDVNQMVTLLVGDRATLFADRGLTLEARVEPNLPLIQADEKMLIQVLTNLMTNAMNYTPAGGTVTVKTGLEIADGGLRIADAQDLHSATYNPQWVTFSVSDTGPGISAEEQAHLFERFYRGEAARQTAVPGTGLGLAICQELVERHGGRMTVESQPGAGSTFIVWLPVTQE